MMVYPRSSGTWCQPCVMPSQVDVNRFASYLASGLAERESDVKMLCYQIMTKICSMMNARDVNARFAIAEP